MIRRITQIYYTNSINLSSVISFVKITPISTSALPSTRSRDPRPFENYSKSRMNIQKKKKKGYCIRIRFDHEKLNLLNLRQPNRPFRIHREIKSRSRHFTRDYYCVNRVRVG